MNFAIYIPVESTLFHCNTALPSTVVPNLHTASIKTHGDHYRTQITKDVEIKILANYDYIKLHESQTSSILFVSQQTPMHRNCVRVVLQAAGTVLTSNSICHGRVVPMRRTTSGSCPFPAPGSTMPAISRLMMDNKKCYLTHIRIIVSSTP